MPRDASVSTTGGVLPPRDTTRLVLTSGELDAGYCLQGTLQAGYCLRGHYKRGADSRGITRWVLPPRDTTSGVLAVRVNSRDPACDFE